VNKFKYSKLVIHQNHQKLKLFPEVNKILCLLETSADPPPLGQAVERGRERREVEY
jgi:hypothetical protein